MAKIRHLSVAARRRSIRDSPPVILESRDPELAGRCVTPRFRRHLTPTGELANYTGCAASSM